MGMTGGCGARCGGRRAKGRIIDPEAGPGDVRSDQETAREGRCRKRWPVVGWIQEFPGVVDGGGRKGKAVNGGTERREACLDQDGELHGRWRGAIGELNLTTLGAGHRSVLVIMIFFPVGIETEGAGVDGLAFSMMRMVVGLQTDHRKDRTKGRLSSRPEKGKEERQHHCLEDLARHDHSERSAREVGCQTVIRLTRAPACADGCRGRYRRDRG